MKTKRLLSALALACLLPWAAWADVYQDPETKVNYEYTPGSGVASVKAGTYSTAGSPEVSGDITILEKFTIDEKEYIVINIGERAFRSCTELTSVAFPDGLESIRDNAFSGCTGLKELILPESLYSIGYYAFNKCTGLSSVFIPKNVGYIGSNPFAYCSDMSTIAVDPDNPHYDSRSDCNAIINTVTNKLIAGCKNTIISEDLNITSIGSDAFAGSGLLSITIPNSVTQIGNSAFRYCEELTTISIPNSVTSIESDAFYGCKSLSAIIIPNSITIINESTFEACHNLQEVVLPDGLTSIGRDAFRYCDKLSSTNIPDGVTSIGESAFCFCKLNEIVIPYGVKEIGKNAFYDCRSERITLPSSLTVIGDKAFDGATTAVPTKTIVSYMTEPVSLHSFIGGDINKIYKATIYIPFGTTETYKATEGWSNFTNFVEMDEEQEEPGKPEQPIPVYEDGDVFVAETEEGIELRYTVISVEDKTCMLGVTEPVGDEWEPTAYTDGNYYHSLIVDGYYSSFALTLPEVVNGLTVVGIGEHALANSTLSGCNIPSTVTFIGDRAFYNTEISNFTVPASVTSIGWDVVSSTNLQTITIGEGNSVYDSRNNCNAIIETATNTLLQGCNSTIIPDDIEAIAYWSLASADKMKELNIPKTVTSIGVMGVPNLEVITVDEENPVYDSRDNCNAIIETSTNTLVVGCKNTIIPETVMAIGDEAFENTSLESIFVPGSVKSIGNGAFYCFNLKEVTLAEGVEYIGESAFIGDEELETITIPSTVAYIGSDAFAYCWKGKTVTSYITTPFDVSGVFRFFGSSQEEPTTLYVPYGTKAKYEAVGGWDVFDNIVEMDCDLIVMEKAMQTYTSSYALDFSTPVEGLKAYTVTAVNDKGKAVLTEVTGAVPAGTGLVLMGTAGEQYAVPCVDGAVESGDNLLVGVTADAEIGGNDTDYILKDGKFVKATAGTLPAGKAYLKIEGSQAREFIEIEGVTTGIGNAVWAASSEGKVYNLNGQRVSQPMRGLYIVNGKKVIK